MKAGDLVLLGIVVGIVVKKPVHKKYAGPVAEILIQGQVKKFKTYYFTWEKEHNAWCYGYEGW